MPAFNEERFLARMVPGCKKYMDKVVVVDDGSMDRTAMGARKEPQINADECRYDFNNTINIFQPGRSNTNHRTHFPELLT